MVHYGKHIIDPKTGLCEICDRGAIHEINYGKHNKRQFLYSNQDGKFTYRPSDEEVHYNHDTTPRHPRRHAQQEAPLSRYHPVEHEYARAPPHQNIRQDHLPINDIQHHHNAHLATLYHIDTSHHVAHRHEERLDEPKRQHPVQNHNPVHTHQHLHNPHSIKAHHPLHSHYASSTHPSRTVHRHAQTPPPLPIHNTFHTTPRRQNNSDTRILERQQRERTHDVHHDHRSFRRAEMFHIETSNDHHRFTTSNSMHPAYHQDYESPHNMNNHNSNKRLHQLEHAQRTHYTEFEPSITKSYNGDTLKRHNAQSMRKVEKIYPLSRRYESLPRLSN